MLFVIFIDNTWTARRFHIILNNSLFLFPGGDCSREIEEMVHGREQKAAGLKGKSLNRKWTFVGSPKKYLKGIEPMAHKHTFSVLTISRMKWGNFSLSRKCVHLLKPRTKSIVSSSEHRVETHCINCQQDGICTWACVGWPWVWRDCFSASILDFWGYANVVPIKALLVVWTFGAFVLILCVNLRI